MQSLVMTFHRWNPLILLIALIFFLQPDTVLGAKQDVSQIVGGNIIQTRYPFLVGLQFQRNDLFCGGTLLSPDWVITAAHCLDRKTKRNIHNVRLVAGTNDLKSKQRQVRKIQSYKIHSSPQKNDVALIKVDVPFTMKANQVARALIEKNNLPANHGAIAIGWGARFERDQRQNHRLRGLDMVMGGNNKCTRELLRANDIPRFQTARQNGLVCAEGKYGNNKGICNGDSGGPLFYRDFNNRNKLIGVASFSHRRCEAKDSWDFFVDLSSYLPWISRTTGLRQAYLTDDPMHTF